MDDDFPEMGIEHINGTYAAILHVVLNRCGGILRIGAAEMPTGIYTIGLHDTDDGGIEVVLFDGEPGRLQ